MTSAVTAALLLVNLAFVVLLVLFSRLVIGDADSISLGRSEGQFPAIILKKDILWKTALPFVAVSSVGFTIWIFFAMILPLRKISRSLDEEDPIQLQSLLGSPTELGQIARQLNGSFQQKDTLRAEIQIRQDLEQQLRQSEIRLQELHKQREEFIHDLHDGLIQSLFSVGLKLDEKRQAIRETQPELADFLLLSTREINVLLAQLRESLHRSVPFLRAVSNLRASLAELVARFDGLGGTRYHFQCGEDLADLLDPVRSIDVQAICSESLMNAMRHARAKNVCVSLKIVGAALHLEVLDDGCGFDPGLREGMGLKSIKQRAQRLGAEVQFKAERGRGSVISLTIPIRDPRGKVEA